MVRVVFSLCLMAVGLPTSLVAQSSPCSPYACESTDCSSFTAAVACDCVAGSFVPSVAMSQMVVAQTAPRMTGYETALRYQQLKARQAVQSVSTQAVMQPAMQQVVEYVPVTSVATRQIDRGSWQMVWVSDPVTEQVAETVYQPRVTYQPLPVQTVFSSTEVIAPTVAETPLPQYAFVENQTATSGVPKLDASDFHAKSDDGAWETVQSFKRRAKRATEFLASNGDGKRGPNKSASIAFKPQERSAARKRTKSRLFEPVRANAGIWQSRFTRGE